MVALFSSLVSNANADSVSPSSSSSSSIPTVIQLHTSDPLLLDHQKKLAGHAILSYQAVEVHDSSEEEDEKETTLFGRTSRKPTSSSGLPESPNLGVWNAKVNMSTTTTDSCGLVDSLLKIPSSSYYVMTVDVTNPSQVEPAMTRMQEALVRHLIANPPTSTKNEHGHKPCTSTSLYDLRDCTFGLAAQDTSTTTTTRKAPEETDRNVCIGLMICAIVQSLSQSSSTDDYVATQAHNLVMYHLRRFAVAVGATLVFVTPSDKTTADAVTATADQDVDVESDKQAALSLPQLARAWREFASGNSLIEENDDDDADDVVKDAQPTAIYVPDKNPELIETVLLRNANCPPNWDASTDSLWKALPAEAQSENDQEKRTMTTTTTTSGDSGWLQQLRDSLGTAATATDSAPASTMTPTKTEDADVSSFFENLLKK